MREGVCADSNRLAKISATGHSQGILMCTREETVKTLLFRRYAMLARSSPSAESNQAYAAPSCDISNQKLVYSITAYLPCGFVRVLRLSCPIPRQRLMISIINFAPFPWPQPRVDEGS